MKHVAFFFLFTVGLLFQIFALSLDVTPEVGYSKGESGEYVFYPDSSYSDDKLSELLWDYGFLYVGAKTGFRGERFSLENGVRFCVASEKDTMSDSDWQNVTGSALDAYQYKTNYSESDNVLCRSVSVNTKASFTFRPLSWLNLSPFVAVDFDYMRFCAKDGWYEYGSEGKYYWAVAYGDGKTEFLLCDGNMVEASGHAPDGNLSQTNISRTDRGCQQGRKPVNTVLRRQRTLQRRCYR